MSAQPVVDYRGYAHLGTGQYAINCSDSGPAEVIISIATDAEAADRKIGERRDNPPGYTIQPEQMAVRLRFATVAGLDALEDVLRELRTEYFPESLAAQHTPGPWKCAFASCQISAANGDTIANVCEYGPQSETPHAQEANARLIAAAPDMLEALRSAVSSIEQLVKLDRIPANNKGLRDARDAIAKATGSASC